MVDIPATLRTMQVIIDRMFKQVRSDGKSPFATSSGKTEKRAKHFGSHNEITDYLQRYLFNLIITSIKQTASSKPFIA